MSSSSLCRFITLKAYVTIAIRLRYDYDEKLTRSFFARVESQTCAIRRSRIVVVSQSNRNYCNHGITRAEKFGRSAVRPAEWQQVRPDRKSDNAQSFHRRD